MSRVLLFTALLGLAACGSDPEPNATPAPQPVAAPKPTTDDPTTRMARAVGGGKPGAAVELRYEFAARPQVGHPVEVQLAFIPGAGVDSLTATITGMEGLTLAGQLAPSSTDVQSGTPFVHTFSLMAEHEGVFYVTVAVITQMGGASVGRSFSIPLIVGESQKQQKAAAQPATDATGEIVQPMPAQEQ